MLDVSATNKGLLIPNIALSGTTYAATITTPAVSLLVYNTATVSDVTPGIIIIQEHQAHRFGQELTQHLVAAAPTTLAKITLVALFFTYIPTILVHKKV
jgi:hypothetical protein